MSADAAVAAALGDDAAAVTAVGENALRAACLCVPVRVCVRPSSYGTHEISSSRCGRACGGGGHAALVGFRFGTRSGIARRKSQVKTERFMCP